MPTLYLIDGYGQFFRAFHAIRTPMTSPVTKEPTNMTFGFLGLLLKLLRGEGRHMAGLPGPDGQARTFPESIGRPDMVAVALDVSGDRGTFRSELYPEYKAHRPPAPDGLGVQVDRCVGLLRTLGVPTLGVPGFEADDVIATLADHLRRDHPGLRVRIVSKDKDLTQLLRPPSDGLAPVEMYDVHTDTLMDAAALKAENGLEPAQVVDMLALMGDAVDNVPGVEGVGEKTAAQLIAKYGTLDNLLAHAGEIAGKRGERLREAAPLLALSRELVTLRRDVPVELDPADAGVERLRLEELLPLCRELGFNRYQDDVRRLLADRGVRAPEPDRPAPAPARPAPARPEPGADLFAGSLFEAAGVAPPAPTRQVEGEYRAITTRQELDALVRTLESAPLIAFDTETDSLDARRARLCGISLATQPGQAWYIPVRSPTPERHLDEKTVLGALGPILEDPARPKCGHNLKFDILVMRAAGVHLRGVAPPPSGAPHGPWLGGDSMISSYLIDPSRSSHSKDALCLALFNRTNIPIAELLGTGKNQRTFDRVPLEQAVPYAAEDADVALQLAQRMTPQLRAMGLGRLWEDVELPLVEVLAELEWNGIAVDAAELDRQRGRLEGRIASLRHQIEDEAMATIGRSFNPESPRQLAEVLFNKPEQEPPGLGLKSLKKTKTGHSTDIEVLEKLAADPALATPPGRDAPTAIPALVVEHRQLTKLVGTYLQALKEAISPETGRVHASFNQTVAATGRLSSSDPNLQNIPIRTEIGREIRRAFVAPPGRALVSADYSQIELRLLAHLSRDPALIEAFHADQDIHTAVAAQIHGVPLERVTKEQRGGAKMVNFGIVYGVTAFGLARRLKIPEKQAAEIIAGYKKKFAGISTFLEECIDQARRNGYVETILKRRRPILGIDSRNPSERSLAERMAINSVVQGSAADLIKVAMVDLHRRLSPWAGARPEVPGVRMLLQIHDELVFEADEATAEDARALIGERMERAMTLSVPLKVDSGVARNWFDGK